MIIDLYIAIKGRKMIYNYIKISESNLWYYAFQMINEFLFHCVKFQNYQIKFEFQKALFWISANLSKLRMKEFGFFIVWKFYFGNFTFSFSFSFPFHAENLTNYKSEQFIIFMNELPNSRKKTKNFMIEKWFVFTSIMKSDFILPFQFSIN